MPREPHGEGDIDGGALEKIELLSSQDWKAGYRRCNFTRASSVVNCQLIVRDFSFRSFSQEFTAIFISSIDAMRFFRHCADTTFSSISAILSQEPCFGV